MRSRGGEYSGLLWRKSRRSVGNGACLEVAPFDGTVAIRDSKDPGGPILRTSRGAWNALLLRAKNGQFDGLCEELPGAHGRIGQP